MNVTKMKMNALIGLVLLVILLTKIHIHASMSWQIYQIVIPCLASIYYNFAGTTRLSCLARCGCQLTHCYIYISDAWHISSWLDLCISTAVAHDGINDIDNRV